MDLSPMNLQVMIPKTTEVGQLQHKLNQQVNVQQDLGTLKMQEDAALKQKQVQSRDRAEDGKIKDESERKQGQSGQQEKREAQPGEENDEAPMAVDSVRGHIIDIKL